MADTILWNSFTFFTVEHFTKPKPKPKPNPIYDLLCRKGKKDTKDRNLKPIVTCLVSSKKIQTEGSTTDHTNIHFPHTFLLIWEENICPNTNVLTITLCLSLTSWFLTSQNIKWGANNEFLTTVGTWTVSALKFFFPVPKANFCSHLHWYDCTNWPLEFILILTWKECVCTKLVLHEL